MSELKPYDTDLIRRSLMAYHSPMTEAEQVDALQTVLTLCDLVDFMHTKIDELVDLSGDALSAIREAIK